MATFTKHESGIEQFFNKISDGFGTTDTWKVAIHTDTDVVFTASGGNLGASTTGRYFSIYDDTPTSPADPLQMYYDYGSTFTVADTETMTLDFAATFWTVAEATTRKG